MFGSSSADSNSESSRSEHAIEQRFYCWRIFAKSLPEKYYFDLYEGFSIKKMTQIRQISKKKLQIARFLLLVPVGSQKYGKDLIFSYLHSSTCGQIWLNHFPDDSHLGYITKLEKRNPATEHWDRFRHRKMRAFFSISSISIAKKSNPAPEQNHTVLRRGALEMAPDSALWAAGI
jgi:hypothetical protein